MLAASRTPRTDLNGAPMRKNLPVTQHERALVPDQRLITTTNLKGVITYVNDDFAEISGFTRAELIGQAHNIIRHPDVPPAVFAHMWAHLKRGQSWMGIVKNRCKDGGYYSVDAFVTPILESGKLVGYESVRVMARPADITRTIQFYKKLNTQRKAVHTDWSGLLRSMVPGMLSGLIASSVVLLCGLPGLLPGMLLAAPVGIYLQRRREHRLHSQFSGRNGSIADPLLAQMYTDEPGAFGQLQTALRSQQARIRTFMSRVNDYTRQLEAQATQGATLSADALRQLEEQKAEADQVAAAVSQMSATSQEVASNVSLTASASREASNQAEQGKQVATQARDAIETLSTAIGTAVDVVSELAQGAREIGAIVDVIHSITEQTNLLALNAAIEAARAGEHGRGFAVVADEVRALARSTADSTGRIQHVIHNLQTSTERAVATMDAGKVEADKSVEYVTAANEALNAITRAINQVGQMSEQIASAAEEQSAVTEEISRSINNIARLSDNTAVEARRHTELSSGLAETARNQADLVARFNLSVQG